VQFADKFQKEANVLNFKILDIEASLIDGSANYIPSHLAMSS
jgi:hypothetical protein